MNVTPLIAAVNSGHLHLIPILIEKGASVHAYDKWGNTILHYACHTPYMKNLEAIKVLLANGADINCKIADNAKAYDDTPAYCAIRHQNYPLLKFLLENGADANARAKSVDSDISLLSEVYRWFINDEDMIPAIKLLLEHGADVGGNLSFIGEVVREPDICSLNLMELLLKYNAAKYINMPIDADGRTVMHYAAMDDGRGEIIELLLAKGAKPGSLHAAKTTGDARSAEKANITADEYCRQLHIMLTKTQHIITSRIYRSQNRSPSTYSMIDMLLKAGADINTQDRFGRTPLQYAVLAYLKFIRADKPEVFLTYH